MGVVSGDPLMDVVGDVDEVGAVDERTLFRFAFEKGLAEILLQTLLAWEKLTGRQCDSTGEDSGQFGLLVFCRQALFEHLVAEGEFDADLDLGADPFGDLRLGFVDGESAECGGDEGIDHDEGCLQERACGVSSPYPAPTAGASPETPNRKQIRVGRVMRPEVGEFWS